MPSFEGLKIRGNQRKSPKIPGIHQSFLAYFIKKIMHDICMLVKARNIFRMACALCEFGCCKAAKMRVGYYLEILIFCV